MAKYLILLFTVLSSSLLKAQTFQPFKVVVTAGYAFPSGDYVKGGLASYLEAQYAINDKISFGLSAGTAAIGPHKKSTFYPNEKFLGNAVMYMATGTYHFNTNKNRPFISLASGLGIVNVHSIQNSRVDAYGIPTFDPAKSRVRKLIISPGAGIERDRLRLMAEYSYLGKAEGIGSSFLTLKAGIFVGGERRKEK